MIDTSLLQTRQANDVKSQSLTNGIHQARSFGESAQNLSFDGTALAKAMQLTNAGFHTNTSGVLEASLVDEEESLAFTDANYMEDVSQDHNSTQTLPIGSTTAMVAQHRQSALVEANSNRVSLTATNGENAKILAYPNSEYSLTQMVQKTQTNELLNVQTSTAQPLQSLLQMGTQLQGQPSLSNPAQTSGHTPLLSQGAEWATVKVDTTAGKWGEQMMQVLHDRASLQAQQHVQEAKIRLDPPELGKLDLVVRVEGDRLNVQINANVTATREALLQVSERLRSELQNQNFVHVDVNVGSGDTNQHKSPNHHENDSHILASNSFSEFDDALSTDLQSPSEHWLNTHA